MIDYKNGKIYKIISDYTDKCYIGSTCQLLSARFANHKHCSKHYDPDKNHFRTSSILFEYNDVQIVLIENYPCKNKEELHARERYWIENLECVNKVVPTRTHKQYYEENKEKISQHKKECREENKEKISQHKKEYYEEHKEEISQHKKEYREENKEKISQHKKEYYEEHKEEISQHKKEYREENKEEISQHKKEYREENKEQISNKRKETIVCDCGLTINRDHLLRHTRSKKHTDALGLPPIEKDETIKNKEKLKRKTYLETNKEKINEKKKEKLHCECGSLITRGCLARHKKSTLHLNNI